ncbi:alginate lyase [Flammeovirga pectinis]|uniref:Alginate lyase n=2 Tax=Flammeovirga pectinis TaxID=2494373 RepID=A0A3Q9FP79_9BACT|nr:alginate lyase [Flammeovirga pectinis]
MNNIEMKQITLTSTLILLTLLFVHANIATAKDILVNNKEELSKALKEVQPGHVILLKNGTWTDVEIKLKGKGTEENKIVLKAETPGKVFLEGQSYLRISGSYIVVSDLVFRNGFTPTSSVISFRTSSKELAYNCRVTNCVVEDYSNTERYDSDKWVEVFGKNNSFDHNALVGKRNKGVTLAVRLNSEESLENNHVIAYNYFGGRQNLGSNGGETLRIGTSHYSRSNSNTTVKNNYFEACDGELEIVSNKSCGNTYQNNVFDECKGTLTLRHGERTLVEGNYFIGNRKHNTGGIRVINEHQTVKNNYLSGLTGYRFRGALVVMNGIYNSPINRYNQVIGAKITNNLLIDSDHVQLCAGSDKERSATPIESVMKNNLFFTATNNNLFTVYDNIEGIDFENNYVNKGENTPVEEGFTFVDYQLEENEFGLRVPKKKLLKKIGFEGDVKLPVTKEEVGPSYYKKEVKELAFNTGKVIKVAAGDDTLIDAAKKSNAGDILELENGGVYSLSKILFVNHPITIRGAEGEKPVVRSEKAVFFKIENGGALKLNHLVIDGADSPDQSGNCVVSTSKYSMNENYKFITLDCDVKQLNINHTFSFLKIYASTMADSVVIENSTFTDVTGSILSLDKEIEDLGMYNAEYVIIKNSKFTKIGDTIADVYRGGTDESTFGPNVAITKCDFTDVGNSKRNKDNSSLAFHGVQNLQVADCNWKDSAPVQLFLTNGEPISNLNNCVFDNTEQIISNNNSYTTKNIQVIN